MNLLNHLNLETFTCRIFEISRLKTFLRIAMRNPKLATKRNFKNIKICEDHFVTIDKTKSIPNINIIDQLNKAHELKYLIDRYIHTYILNTITKGKAQMLKDKILANIIEDTAKYG